MADPNMNIPLPTPGEPAIPFVNWVGMRTLYVKEVRRFFKVQLQTIWAPAMQTLLFLVIFTVAMGRSGSQIMGHDFAAFVAPGLIVSTGMMQAAYANGSFSLMSGKMNGTIVDYLMPPISTAELLAALVGAAVTRAVLVGITVWIAMSLWPGVQVLPEHLWAVIWFGLMASTLLALLGVLTSIWADKFDQAAAVQNFLVAPLTLLSGTFYSIDHLQGPFRAISHANPFFYAISGFRYGFIGTTDSPLLIGALLLPAINVVLAACAYRIIGRGWKLKN